MLVSADKLLAHLDKEEDRLCRERDETVILRNKQPGKVQHDLKISNIDGALNQVFALRAFLKADAT